MTGCEKPTFGLGRCNAGIGCRIHEVHGFCGCGPADEFPPGFEWSEEEQRPVYQGDGMKTGRPEGRPVVATRGEDLSGFPHRRNLEMHWNSKPRVPQSRLRFSSLRAELPSTLGAVRIKTFCYSRLSRSVAFSLHLTPPTMGTLTRGIVA